MVGVGKISDNPNASFALLEECRGEILANYERALEVAGSLLVQDHRVKAQVMAIANQILSDMGTALLAGLPQSDEPPQFHAWDIALPGVTPGVYPRESLLAASVLFRTAFTTLSQRIQDDSETALLLRRLVTTLEQSVSTRSREAAISYAGFLLSKVHEAHLAERRRIARELHDRIGQCLSVAHRQAELAAMHQDGDPAKALAKIEQTQKAVSEAMWRLRQLTSDLHRHAPIQSLEKELLAYIDVVSSDDVKVELEVNGDENWVAPAISEECLLILTEATRNALNHARASGILIRVDIAPHALLAAVIDDGRGFDSARAPAQHSLGLVSIQERVALLGGTVTITSEVGRGTRIDLAVPL